MSKFQDFDREDLVYAEVHGQPLLATLLVPRSTSEHVHPRPVLVHWHGGGFVVGHRLYEPWFPDWLVSLALDANATVILPDYRLLPEASSGTAILADVAAFWTWLRTHAQHVKFLDLSRVACVGTSSGGYLALQSALHYFPDLRVLITLAGSLAPALPALQIPTPRTILGQQPPPPPQATALVREYVKRHCRPDAVRTEGDPVSMWELVTCVFQQGYIGRWFQYRSNPWLDPVKVIEDGKEGPRKLPPMWIVHGAQDSVVNPQCSTAFVEALGSARPEVPVLLQVVPGEHGFENSASTGSDEWLRDGMRFALAHWPGADECRNSGS